MIVTLFIISSLLLIGCISLGVMYWKVSNGLFSVAKKHVDALYKYHNKVKCELDKREAEITKKDASLSAEYNKLKNNLFKKEEELKKDYEKRKAELDEEIDEAVREAEEALEENIANVDNMLENRIAEITAKNTRMFNCLCSDKPIPCFIDLSQENTYRCPDCGGVYRVEITMNPIMIGKAISDEQYVQMIKTRIEEEQNAEYYGE